MFQSAPSGAFRPPEVSIGPTDYYMPSMPLLSAEEDIAATTTDISVRLADFGTDLGINGGQALV
ncbi:unnamed protein product [Clonostachys rosea]|uniref:Uncharacterized protein n=1 Tax=Bionectria ochroleuca TaxID=29856 RepID=A0ABY6U4F8_BIOOC|nr:unnamed protein product [Clonostachys rosea]